MPSAACTSTSSSAVQGRSPVVPGINSLNGGGSDGQSETRQPSELESTSAPAGAGGRRQIRGALAGAVVGVLITALLLVTGRIAAPLRFSDRDATDDFLAAWARSRTGTFVVDSEWKRVKPSGEAMVSASRLVQAPPNRVLRQIGGVVAELDGERVNCFTRPTGEYNCNDGFPLHRTFDEGVQQELSDLNDHFRKSDPGIYRVRTDEHGCFELVQTRPYPNPTFGRFGQVCFDEGSGAMRFSERHFEGVTEILRAVQIRKVVTPADLDLSPDPAFKQRTDTTAPSQGGS